jgi:hypothetical protein
MLEPLYTPGEGDAEELAALAALAGDTVEPATAPETPEPEVEAAPDYDAEARKQGWVPKEEFKGDPAKWKPAKEFVEFGDRIGTLKREVDDVKAASTRMFAELRRQQEKEARRQQEEFTAAKADYEARIRQLTESKYQALGAGDIDQAKNDELELLRLQKLPPLAPPPPQEEEPPIVAAVRAVHADLPQIMQSDEFQVWLINQPPAVQQGWYGSPHARVGIEILNRYKRDTGQAKETVRPPPSPVAGARGPVPKPSTNVAFSSLPESDRKDFQYGVSMGVYKDTDQDKAAFAKVWAGNQKRG